MNMRGAAKRIDIGLDSLHLNLGRNRHTRIHGKRSDVIGGRADQRILKTVDVKLTFGFPKSGFRGKNRIPRFSQGFVESSDCFVVISFIVLLNSDEIGDFLISDFTLKAVFAFEHFERFFVIF